MKRGSTSLITGEMQIKTIMKYPLTPVRMTIIKESTNNKFWRGHGKEETLLHCRWQYTVIQPLWRIIWRFFKKLKIELPYMNQQSHSWAYIWRKPQAPQCSLQHYLQ